MIKKLFIRIFKGPANPTFEQVVRRKTTVSFLWFAVAIVFAFGFWKWLNMQPRDAGALRPLRMVMNANEKIFATLFYSNNNVAPTYNAMRAAKRVRVNGKAGMDEKFDATTWKLKVVRTPGDTLFLSLDAIKALPKTEIIFDFKCVEGWDQVTHWGGVKFSDFAAKYNVGAVNNAVPDLKNYSNLYPYAGLETPDKGYFVSMDMPSMLHPQTLLCYEMNGKPLPDNQGFPLRLITPVKYGVKNIKRIGTIFFSNTQPRDYWAERGYDYYLGL